MKVVKTVKIVEADDGKKFVGENAEKECAVTVPRGYCDYQDRMLGSSTIQRKYRFQFGK